MRNMVVPGLVAGVLAVAIAALTPAIASPAQAAARPTSSPACAAAHLQAQLAGSDRDNTDLYRFIELTNTGPSCVFRGRAALSMERHGRRTGVAGDYFPYSPDRRPPRIGPVRVPQHGHAAIWLALAPADGTACRRVQIDGFIIGLPTRGHLTAPVPARQRSEFVVCASRTAHLLDYSQFLTGTGTR